MLRIHVCTALHAYTTTYPYRGVGAYVPSPLVQCIRSAYVVYAYVGTTLSLNSTLHREITVSEYLERVLHGYISILEVYRDLAMVSDTLATLYHGVLHHAHHLTVMHTTTYYHVPMYP